MVSDALQTVLTNSIVLVFERLSFTSCKHALKFKVCIALYLISMRGTTLVFCRESRYLLVLTENYAALRLLQSKFHRDHDPVVIFGSSFPKDQQYTQV